MMRKLSFLAVSVVCLWGFYCSNAFSQTVNIDASTEYQTIRGFGGHNGVGWIDDLTPAQVDTAFGNGDNQLGLSIMRMRIDPDSGRWSLQVPAAQRASSLYGATLMATPWTPPAYMKSNNSLTNGGVLLSQYYTDYTDHLLAFADYMASNGAPIYAISLANEPDWHPDYESSEWLASDFTNYLNSQGSRFGSLKVIAPESLNFKHSLSDPFLNDSNTAQHVDIIGGHLYGVSVARDYPLARSLGKELWMTEHYTDSSNSANDWPLALDVGVELHRSMVANYNAYVWWYIRRSYGLLTEDGHISKRGYIMANYSKYVRPGYVRIGATANPYSDVYVTAYKGPNNQLVVVAVNTGTSDRELDLNLQNFSVGSFTQYSTSSTQNVEYSDVWEVSGGKASVWVDPQSVATFVGGDPAPEPTPAPEPAPAPEPTPEPMPGPAPGATCDSPMSVSLPLAIDGAGEFCRVTTGDISTINSWNMQLVEINGETFTNTWSNRMPAKIDGNYYIHYVGKHPWSHLEVNGSGGSSSESSGSNSDSASSSSSSRSSDGPAGYTFCANENGTCAFSGTREVAYGANGQFTYAEATGGITCNNETFGDPIYGVAKACYYANTETDSSDASSGSGGGEQLVLQENETGFCSVEGSIDSNHSGFTGSGFANTANAEGNRIIWRVNAQTSDTYTLDWRYANGGSTSRSATIYIGSEQAGVTFPSTGSWSSWTNDVADLYLNSGENIITLVADTPSGLPNIDSLSITGSGLSGVDCAESGANDEDTDDNDFGSCGSGNPDATVEGSSGSYTARRGANLLYSGGDYRSAIQAALDSLDPGRSSQQRVSVLASGSIGASSIRLPSHTALEVCGAMDVGNRRGHGAIEALDATDVSIPFLKMTGNPYFGLWFYGMNGLHLGQIRLELSDGLGIRFERDKAGSSNVTMDDIYVSGTGNHGVETWNIDGLTIGTLVARNTKYCGLLLNNTRNATIGTVDGDNVASGTGYATFRLANGAGQLSDGSYNTNITVDKVKSRGGGRGFFCVSQSGGLSIRNVDLADNGSNAVLIENCYTVSINGGTVNGGGEVRVAARDEFPNTRDVDITLTVNNTSVRESPCGDNVNWNISGNASVNVCD